MLISKLVRFMIMYTTQLAWYLGRGKSVPVCSLPFSLSSIHITMCSFLGYCHKIPQTRWSKTPKMYSLMVLEATSLKSRCRQGLLFLEALEKNLFHTSPLASGGCHQSLVQIGLDQHNSSLYLCLYKAVFPPGPNSSLLRR